ncbi:MAG: hypothetical protein CBC01_03345 [Betaproteobacteria bacterium TMED41]|nr:MAG: hypothetical protein CBC01_03345 [Betaproteobacteria bacterium TMED41]
MNDKSNGLVRFITAGSVDDGKSTLIGRLLYDSKSILADQLSVLASAKNSRLNSEGIDFAFLTDGLESEREQGITIDVAYRYFSTKNKKFIIADCPGHEQYTRNMVTGASTADSVIFLIDVSEVIDGKLLIQTKRHVAISCLLNISNFILAVNKMDLVNYDESIYEKIVFSFAKLLETFDKKKSFTAVPISALHGDNIVKISNNMKWYKNETLISCLENKNHIKNSTPILRFPVQFVMRWDGDKKKDQRAYCGKIHSGEILLDEKIKIWPSDQSAKISKLVYLGKEVNKAFTNQCVTIWLDRDIDLARGDVIVNFDNFPILAKEFNANIAWLDSQNLNPSRKYTLRQATRETKVKVEVINKLNLSSLNRETAETLFMNEIGRTRIKSAKPILIDKYDAFPKTGSFILIDDSSHQTCAAGMIC